MQGGYPGEVMQRILLVDDNDELRGASAALLTSAGYHVLEAADADQARACFDQHGGGIDVVVTDVNMPGDDGTVLAEALRQVEPRLPILFISSHVGARLGKRLARGDVAFLAKPFGPASLVRSIEHAQRVAADVAPLTSPAPVPDTHPSAHHSSRPSSRQWPRLGLASWLAAAAGVILAIGVTAELRRDRAPALPDVVPSSVTRSLTVETLFPVGELLTRPATLSWRTVGAADAYRVELRRIGYDMIFEAEVERSTVALPDTVRALVEPGVEYTWRVVALADNQVLASSREARFRLDPRSSAMRIPDPDASGR